MVKVIITIKQLNEVQYSIEVTSEKDETSNEQEQYIALAIINAIIPTDIEDNNQKVH